MRSLSCKFSKTTLRALLLTGVYAAHLFLFIGLTVFSQPSSVGVHSTSQPVDHSGTSHDPASVECRSLFKYDDSKQQLVSNSLPESAVLNSYIIPSDLSASKVITSSFAIKPAFSYSKLYCLFRVFLI